MRRVSDRRLGRRVRNRVEGRPGLGGNCGRSSVGEGGVGRVRRGRWGRRLVRGRRVRWKAIDSEEGRGRILGFFGGFLLYPSFVLFFSFCFGFPPTSILSFFSFSLSSTHTLVFPHSISLSHQFSLFFFSFLLFFRYSFNPLFLPTPRTTKSPRSYTIPATYTHTYSACSTRCQSGLPTSGSTHVRT